MLTTAKKLGATAAGAAIGAVVGGPVGLAVGAVAGGITDYVRDKKTRGVKIVPAKLAPAPHVAAKPVSKAFPHVTPPKAVQVATVAATSPPPEATALYGYFKAHPFDAALGSSAYQSVQLGYLVGQFQTAYNSNAASKTTGPLPTSGRYDSRTAAALILFSHDDPSKWNPPFPPDPSAG